MLHLMRFEVIHGTIQTATGVHAVLRRHTVDLLDPQHESDIAL